MLNLRLSAPRKRKCVTKFIFEINTAFTKMALREKKDYRLDQIINAAQDMFKIDQIRKMSETFRKDDIENILNLCQEMQRKFREPLIGKTKK